MSVDHGDMAFGIGLGVWTTACAVFVPEYVDLTPLAVVLGLTVLGAVVVLTAIAYEQGCQRGRGEAV